MKRYKNTYGTSIVFFFLRLLIICTPAAFIAGTVLALIGYIKVWSIFLAVILSLLCGVFMGVIFIFLITSLINLFKDFSVFVNEKYILYNKKTLDLDSIKYLTLYLPKMQSRSNFSPQELSIYIDDKEHIVIRRPSIALVLHLKKRCKNAKFKIDELKSRLKIDFIIGLCTAVAVLVIGFITMK